MNNKSMAMLVSWNLIRLDDRSYGIAFTHHSYLRCITGIFEKVYLITGVREIKSSDKINYNTSEFKNVEVVCLPEITGFVAAQKHFLKYYKTLNYVCDKVDVVYCRVPDPFSWMPKLLFRKKTIMHYVGDTIDTTKNNEKWSLLKKAIMIAGYMPDYLLTLLASRGSKVYTNGNHLQQCLKKYGIHATPVVSSTVSVNDLVGPISPLKNKQLRLIYVGYIRFAKGMHCLMQLWLLLKRKYPNFIFDLVGNGEMFDEVKLFVIKNKLEDNVILHGHIDNRERLNELLRADNLFVFPSLSEGSPRVIIEAMAQGIPVVSTPVGSLPTTFIDGKTIRFFNFNDTSKVMDIINEYVVNRSRFILQRNRAFGLVKQRFTIEQFLTTIFTHEA